MSIGDVKISGLPAAGVLTGAELVEAVQGGASVRTTAALIAALAGSGSSFGGGWDWSGTNTDLTFTVPAPLGGFWGQFNVVDPDLNIRFDAQGPNGGLLLTANGIAIELAGNTSINMTAPIVMIDTALQVGTIPVGPVAINLGTTRGRFVQLYNAVSIGNAGVTAHGFNGSEATPTAMLSGDPLGVFGCGGYTGAAFTSNTGIRSFATENWSPTQTGSKWTMHVTRTGTATQVNVLDMASSAMAFGNATTNPTYIFLGTQSITHGSTTLLKTSVALTNGAAGSTGTLTNAPAVGNPTKWIPIDDNGTTRYIPAW